MMISFDLEEKSRFHFRAAGIFRHEGRVLFQKPVEEAYWFLPGGRVEFDEPAEEALRREMVEEFDLQIESCKLAWVAETFLPIQGRNVHEVAFYFLVEMPGDHPLLSLEGEFEGAEPGYVNKWIDIREFDQHKIVPEFVPRELQSWTDNQTVKHLVNREVR